MSLTIRPATMDDYDAICDLMAQIDKLHRDQHPEVFQEATPAREPEAIEYWITPPDRQCLLAEINGHIAGVTMAAIHHTPPIPILRPRSYVAIDTLVTDSAHARQGAGTALMQAVHEWGISRGIHEFQLGVWAFNQGAIAFYEKLGYSTFMYRMVWHNPDAGV